MMSDIAEIYDIDDMSEKERFTSNGIYWLW